MSIVSGRSFKRGRGSKRKKPISASSSISSRWSVSFSSLGSVHPAGGRQIPLLIEVNHKRPVTGSGKADTQVQGVSGFSTADLLWPMCRCVPSTVMPFMRDREFQTKTENERWNRSKRRALLLHFCSEERWKDKEIQ